MEVFLWQGKLSTTGSHHNIKSVHGTLNEGEVLSVKLVYNIEGEDCKEGKRHLFDKNPAAQ